MSVEEICGEMGISRQAYYQMLRREKKEEVEEEKILSMVKMIRRKHPRMGARKLLVKIAPMMAQEGLRMGRDRFFELLRARGLLVPRKRRMSRTTWSGSRRMPNHLAGVSIDKRDMAWVADITYLDVESKGFMYLFMLMDLYSRYVVGWKLGDSLSAVHAVDVLERGVVQTDGSNLEGLIHHSDHGVQYTSNEYLQSLEKYGMVASMGEIGNAYDNAYAERVLGTLKREYGLDDAFGGVAGVRSAVEEAVYLYNHERPHLSLGYATPASVYQGGVEAVGVVVKTLVPAKQIQGV